MLERARPMNRDVGDQRPATSGGFSDSEIRRERWIADRDRSLADHEHGSLTFRLIYSGRQKKSLLASEDRERGREAGPSPKD